VLQKCPAGGGGVRSRYKKDKMYRLYELKYYKIRHLHLLLLGIICVLSLDVTPDDGWIKKPKHVVFYELKKKQVVCDDSFIILYRLSILSCFPVLSITVKLMV
jgi:hypothetical protein